MLVFEAYSLILKIRMLVSGPFYTIMCCHEPGFQPCNGRSIVGYALGQDYTTLATSLPDLFSAIAMHMHFGGVSDLQLHGTLSTNPSLGASFLDAKPSSILSPFLQLSTSP